MHDDGRGALGRAGPGRGARGLRRPRRPLRAADLWLPLAPDRGDREDAADLTQLTFLKAYRGLPAIDAELNFNAWLHRIAANACRDWQRHRLHFQWLPWDARAHERRAADRLDDPEVRVVAAETRREVRRVLRRMRPHYRRALVLAQFGGLSCEAIGARLGLSRSAAKALLHRARAEFRALYRNEGR